MSHCLTFYGPVSQLVPDLTIGQIILPADGPWLVHHISAQCTGTNAMMRLHPRIRLVPAITGTEPHPIPLYIPTNGFTIGLATAQSIQVADLYRVPVAWQSPGKMRFDIHALDEHGAAIPEHVTVAMYFGKRRPTFIPAKLIDRLSGGITKNTTTLLGMITLAETATRIVGISGRVTPQVAQPQAEEIVASFTLESDDIDLTPSTWPIDPMISGFTGGEAHAETIGPQKFIPVDISVPSGARINVYFTIMSTMASDPYAQFFLAYE